MKYIRVYDIEGDRIEALADKYGTTEAEIIELLLDNLAEQDEDEIFG